MRLILFRHGIARDAVAGQDDAQRPLTARGIKRTALAARGLASCLEKNPLGDRPVIYSSPKVRAWQTAEILAATLDVRVSRQSLLGGMDVHETRRWIHTLADQEVVLVGHEPQLGNLASLLCTGHRGQLSIELKKAGAVILMGLHAQGPQWCLQAILPPRMLRLPGTSPGGGGACLQESL